MLASVHDEYEAMRATQRAAMAEQNALDAEQLARMQSSKSLASTSEVSKSTAYLNP